MTKCGHEARTFDGAPLVCEKPKGHKGLHERRVTLRDKLSEVTNWDDAGRGIADGWPYPHNEILGGKKK